MVHSLWKSNWTSHFFLFCGTIDQAVYRLIQDKKNTAAQIMNSDDDIPTEEAYFNELVNLFMENGDMQDGRAEDNPVPG